MQKCVRVSCELGLAQMNGFTLSEHPAGPWKGGQGVLCLTLLMPCRVSGFSDMVYQMTQ